jgi:TonB family protein
MRRNQKRLPLGISLLLAVPLLAAQESRAARAIVQQSPPAYPALARNMALEGTVKLEAAVLPDGTVKSVAVKGGHPVLAQAAAKAVKLWKWEPGPRESDELVQVRFAPEQ